MSKARNDADTLIIRARDFGDTSYPGLARKTATGLRAQRTRHMTAARQPGISARLRHCDVQQARRCNQRLVELLQIYRGWL